MPCLLVLLHAVHLVGFALVGNASAALVCVRHLDIETASAHGIVVIATQRTEQPEHDDHHTDDGSTKHHHLVALQLFFLRQFLLGLRFRLLSLSLLPLLG